MNTKSQSNMRKHSLLLVGLCHDRDASLQDPFEGHRGTRRLAMSLRDGCCQVTSDQGSVTVTERAPGLQDDVLLCAVLFESEGARV